jgi:GNAT superfamily N-acetyltransferase
MPEILTPIYIPGIIGAITSLHAKYYYEYWHFSLSFESKVATELSAFMERLDPACDRIWVAVENGEVIGSLVIDGSDASGEGARLRWFIVAPEYQGKGLGNRLMDEAIEFCHNAGFGKVYLTTFVGLQAASHLYEKAGFTLIEEREDDNWGKTVIEQKFELLLE